MDYFAMKKSFQAFINDLNKYPLRTVFLGMLFLIAILGFDSAREVISDRAVSLFNQSEKPSQQTVAAGIQNIDASSTIELKPMQIKKDNKQFEVDIKYPSFNLPDLDKTISDFIAREINKAQYEDYSDVSTGAQKGISGGYDSPYIDSDVISFKEDICSYVYIDVDIQSRCLDKEYGFSFDRKSDRLIKLEDALTMVDLSLEQLVGKIKQKYPNTAQDPMFSDGFRPLNSNFSEFLVTKDSVTFLFPKYQLGPGVMGPQEVTFARVK